jgi:hypothetical protein
MYSYQVRIGIPSIYSSFLVSSTTQQTKTKTGVYESKGRYFLAHNSLTDVSISLVFLLLIEGVSFL